MSRFGVARLFISMLLLAVLASVSPAIAVEKTPSQFLPKTTVVYLEINRPGELVSYLLDSPLGKQAIQSDAARKTMATPKFKELQAIVGMIEQRADVKWRGALETVTAGGLVIAYDADSQGVALLAKSNNAKTADSVRDAFFTLFRDDAKNKGNPDPIEQTEYRGFSAYKVGDGIVGNLGPWLLLTNKSDLAKSMADRFLDGGESLADDPHFIDAHHLADTQPTAWAFVQLEPLHALAPDNPLLDAKYKSDNPGAEFLVGGLLPIVQKAACLSASLSVAGDDIKLSVAAPTDPATFTQDTKFFFASPGDGAPRALRPAGTLLSVSMYRDASAMWQAGPDLFTDAVATQMAQADSGLSTFFGGKSFGADVLGAFKPHVQLIAVKQDYKAAGVNEPALKLPGFALVLGVKEAQFNAVKKHMRIGFQSAIAFANIDGAGKGRPALELQTEKRAGSDIQFATYDMTDKPAAKDDVYLNFTPAIVMSSKYMMLCSTREIAEQLADLAEKQDDKDIVPENTFIQIDGSAIASLIKSDREPLIAQNMLEKGHDRSTAEKEVNVLEALVNAVKDAEVRLTPGAHSIKLDVDIKTSRDNRKSE